MIDEKLKLQRSMRGGLYRALLRGESFDFIFDVGAARGDWSMMAKEFFPEAKYVLFEPLDERSVELSELAKKEGFTIVNKAVGAKSGNIELYVTSDLDGTGIADNGTNAPKRSFPLTTIDDEVASMELNGKTLIKLDTHGYELPIIEGAKNILKKAELVIMECYGQRIATGSLLFWEMCAHMNNLGFGLIDIVDVMYREWDLSFWQCDAFFVPKNYKSFKTSTYHK